MLMAHAMTTSLNGYYNEHIGSAVQSPITRQSSTWSPLSYPAHLSEISCPKCNWLLNGTFGNLGVSQYANTVLYHRMLKPKQKLVIQTSKGFTT